jgi:sarcosine oxidase subunit beta
MKEGFLDLETIKRYTGLGTGACQGKSCIPLLSEILSNKNSKPFTARNPCTPLAFKYFNEK